MSFARSLGVARWTVPFLLCQVRSSCHSAPVLRTKPFLPFVSQRTVTTMLGSQKASMKVLPEPACGAITGYSAVVFEGSMYIFGGLINGVKTNRLWKCSMDEYEWTPVTPAKGTAPPHSLHAAVVFERSMYIFGSTAGDDGGMGNIYVFNFDTLEWDTLARDSTWPSFRACLTAAVVGKGMFVFSGFTHFKDGTSFSAPDLWRFDFASHSWSREWLWDGETEGDAWLWKPGNGPRPRHAHSTAAWGDELVVYGGDLGKGHDNDELWIWNTQTRTWSQVTAHGPGPRYFHSAVVDAKRGAMVVVGRFAQRCMYEGGQIKVEEYNQAPKGEDELWELDLVAKQWRRVKIAVDGGEGTNEEVSKVERASAVCAVLSEGDRGLLLVLGGHEVNARGPSNGAALARFLRLEFLQ